MRLIALTTVTAVGLVIAALSLAGAAQAAPSMSIDQVYSPTGAANPGDVWRTDDHTTWHVGLRGIGAWDDSDCSSTARYTAYGEVQDGYTDTVEGEDADPNGPWNSWSFTAETPTGWMGTDAASSYDFVPLARIGATCKLTRHRYVGRRYYRSGLTLYKEGPQTFRRRPNGCKIYSYSVGALTIDCRHSRSSGSASWSFKVRPSDGRARATLYFDSSRSTIGAHPMTVSRSGFGRYVNVTETVSAGTMITVTSVETSVSRRYSRKVWRDESKTLRANFWS
jgi:hypothetical protein